MMETTNSYKTPRKWIRLLGVLLLLGIFICLLRIWFSSEKIELFVPIKLKNIPDGLTLSHLPLKELELNLRSPKYLSHTLAKIQNRYVLDLSDVCLGINHIPVQQDCFRFPRAIRIESIIPPVVTLKIERSMTKEVPVMVTVSGKPAAGFVFVDAVARPSSVVLRGPESILGSIEKVMTKAVDISGLSENHKKEITLDLVEMLESTEPKRLFLAEIFIERKVTTKTFNNIPVIGKDTLFAYDITPELIGIEISGPVKILEKLAEEKNINAYVDLKDLKPGVYVRPAVISLPIDTTLVSVDTEIFTVSIK